MKKNIIQLSEKDFQTLSQLWLLPHTWIF